MTPEIRYRFSVSVPAATLRRAQLLYEHAMLNGCGGIDLKDLGRRDYPVAARKLLHDWLAAGKPLRGTVLMQTWRNLIQNPRCIAYSRVLGICQSRHEMAERSQRPYYGIAFLTNGKLRAERYSPSVGMPDDVEQFGGGVPVLWDRRVLTLEEMAPEVADFPHLWQLQVSSFGTPVKDLERFVRLQAVFEQFRHAPQTRASEALLEEARGLARERNYPHQVAGVRADGGLVVVVAHGSLEHMGELAREAGAVAAVVVDNGGSPAVALRRKADSDLRTLVESYYHRPLSIAVALYELEGDPETRFASQIGAYLPVRSLRAAETVSLEFGTGMGLVRRDLTFRKLDYDAADLTAITIGNFAVVHGALGVKVGAAPEFVSHVVSAFRQRYRATSVVDDPTRLRGCWLENYLADANRAPFDIGMRLQEERKVQAGKRFHDSDLATRVLGIDIGGNSVKCLLRVDGKIIRESEYPTLRTEPGFTSVVLAKQLKGAVTAVTNGTGTGLWDIQAIGVSWAGAVDGHGQAATSKIILDMMDVLRDGAVDRNRLDEVRNIPEFVRAALELPASVCITAFNDGDVEALCEAHRLGRREVLLLKVGTTVAGGYVDAEGSTNYLTEIGRCVLRADSGAPRHPYSKIQGFASRLIGTEALYEIGSAAGLLVTKNDAGRDFCSIVESSPEARRIVMEMGGNLADLLVEVTLHLPKVQHVILRGGLLGKHAVGMVLRSQMMENLPEDLARKLAFEDDSVHSGAAAAAWLAARLLQPESLQA